MSVPFRIIVMVVSLGLFVAGSGHAESQYWTAELGAFSSDESDFDTGYTLEGSYGLPITSVISSLEGKTPFWSKVWLEAGLAYSHAEFDETTVIPGFPPLIPDQVITVKGEVDVVPITVSGLIRHPLKSNFELYGGAGLGLYYVMIEAGGGDDDSIELGAHLVGGVGYSFTDKLAATAEMKFAKVGEDAAGGLNVNFGVRYSF